MAAIKVMITDDHSMVREGIKQLLEIDGEFKVVAEASDGFECLERIANIRPDILLLDINMPNMNGLEVLKVLRRRRKKLRIMVLTVHNEIEYLVKAIDIGINGYILKDSESSELKKAIRTIVSGEDYIQPSLIPALNTYMIDRDNNMAILDSLTDREIEVLKLLAMGLYNKEIADKLFISERTVKNHISNIFKKIEVSDRTQAAVFAIRNNLVTI